MTSFDTLLEALLPPALPHRARVREGAALHLARIVETNRYFNLTRITEEREAVIKHVVDSLIPWTLFEAAAHVADAGTGAGFPGIPLALALPATRFTLIESTQKKARFVETVANELGLANVTVSTDRAETWLSTHRVEVVTGRAVAPVDRALKLFAPALKQGARLLLYKGPDPAEEIQLASPEARRLRVQITIALRYELPEAMGARTVVEVR